MSCCAQCGEHGCACGCGPRPGTLLPLYNRPGLDALSYRIGRYGQFRATMQAQLSDAALPALAGLRTREASDAAMSLLDAWAAGADVLTFYQERIANEGYLRTATQRRSVVELARLVDYRPRPGVAASVYLAYQVDAGSAPVVVPKGAKAQSIPAPGEKMQVFETSEDLEARLEWNALKPREQLPQHITRGRAASNEAVWLQGSDLKLKTNDRLLFVFGNVFDGNAVVRVVDSVEPDIEGNRTRVALQPEVAPAPPVPVPRPPFTAMYRALRAPPALQPANRLRLARNAQAVLGIASDVRPQLLTRLDARLADTLYPAWTSRPDSAASSTLTGVFALRVAAPLFGYNAPHRAVLNLPTDSNGFAPADDGDWQVDETDDVLQLDNAYDGIAKGSYLVVESGDTTVVGQAKSVQVQARSAYAVSGKTTRIVLENRQPEVPVWPQPDAMSALRGARVLAQSEALALAEVPIAQPVGAVEVDVDVDDLPLPDDDAKHLTLATALDGFKTGRWVVVEGERVDVDSVPGVRASELVMVEAIEQGADPRIPGDRVHSTLVLANEGLAYRYRRDSVRIRANVVHATHGETRSEALGNGDGARALQAFLLKQPPLTHVSAATPAGIASTLGVRVNGVAWHEVRNLALADAQLRAFATQADDDGKTRVVFGDGEHGARLPTGSENVRATYRTGIGLAGNVRAGQISQAGTRPLGVKDVTNPLRASGGADPETRDQARANVPLAVLALDRLVSVADYADFARTFGGLGKAVARRLGDLVHVTIAGAADAPVDVHSDLYRNLLDALRRYGDPVLQVRLDVRELVALSVQAKVGVQADHAWEFVEPMVRAALLDRFGFERAEPGRNLYRSQVIACIQAVRGVAWVDLDLFGGLGEAALLAGFDPPACEEGQCTTGGLLEGITTGIDASNGEVLVVKPARWETDPGNGQSVLRPAQIAYLPPEVPDVLLLQEATP